MTADPHNDQLAAQVRDDLDQLTASATTTLRQADDEGHSEVDALATIAHTLDAETDAMPRDRLAALLALALVRLAKDPTRAMNGFDAQQTAGVTGIYFVPESGDRMACVAFEMVGGHKRYMRLWLVNREIDWGWVIRDDAVTLWKMS